MKRHGENDTGDQVVPFLKEAFTHRSWAHEKGIRGNNERLEFLGDVVLSLVISEYLFGKFPHLQEGELARMRGGIVCTEALAVTARKLGLGKQLLLGKGEESSGGREKESILANTFEAVVGGIYLREGLERVKTFILENHCPVIKKICSREDLRDAKTRLQEVVQKRFKKLPEYHLMEEKGPDHCKCFIINVYLDKKIMGRGEGPTKKIAQQNAAAQALLELKKRKRDSKGK